jgi:hypothetical protein
MSPPLRLRAEDEEDLRIISAHVQDAVIRIGDLAYLPKTRRFALLLNRYCWEDADRSCARMRAGLHFEGVLRARSFNVRQDDPEAVVELLALRYAEGQDGAGTVDLLLAGGGCIRLDVECIDATLRDLEGPWPAKGRPAHDLDGGKEESA